MRAPFSSLPMPFAGILAIWMMILLIGSVIVVLKHGRQNRSTFVYVLDVLFFEIEFVLHFCLARLSRIETGEVQTGNFVTQMLDIPLYMPLVLVGICTIWQFVQTVYNIYWNRNHITRDAIKRSIDEMDMGICVFEKTGAVRFINAKMEELVVRLTGDSMRNGIHFWQWLQTFSREDSDVILTSVNNRMFSFQMEEIHPNNLTLFELRAVDVTEIYQKNLELIKESGRLREMNARMRELNNRITEVTIEKEILQTKTDIHDNLGQALLATRRYIAEPSGEEALEEIKRLWNMNLGSLRKADAQEKKDSYELMRETAEAVGIELIVRGDLPQGRIGKDILSTAMHECLTNTIRHAKGTTLFVTVQWAENGWTAVLNNDGEAPNGKIKETGGLKNLREKVESAGGKMNISSKPRFNLSIFFPRERMDRN